MFRPPAAFSITEERTFSAQLGRRTVTGLAVADAWEGFTKYTTPTGECLIVLDAEQRLVTGSPMLIAELTRPQDPLWATVPETTLPGGLVVPSFQVARHLASRNDADEIVIDPSMKPLVNINFSVAQDAAHSAGWNLITETQWLAIAWNLSGVASNWSGGAVGEGKMFQGIRTGGKSHAGNALRDDLSEQRWLTLSNGEELCDFNGNVFSWVFDDVQGNSSGVIAKTITTASLSKSVAQVAGAAGWRTNGLGFQPSGDSNWAGYALIRGGCFYSEDRAGVFRLVYVSPVSRLDFVGFRVTK